MCVRAAVLNCHGGALVGFHKLRRTARSSRVHETESMSMMGHARSAAVCFTGSDQKT